MPPAAGVSVELDQAESMRLPGTIECVHQYEATQGLPAMYPAQMQCPAAVDMPLTRKTRRGNSRLDGLQFA